MLSAPDEGHVEGIGYMKHMLVVVTLLALRTAPVVAQCSDFDCQDYASTNAVISWTEIEPVTRPGYGYDAGSHAAAAGNILWVVSYSRLISYDVSDVSHPRMIREVPADGFDGWITIVGNLAFTTGRYGLLVTDITDPQRPVARGVLRGGALYNSVYRNGYLYAGGYNRAVTIDVRDPGRPTITSQYSTLYLAGPVALHGSELVVLESSDLMLCFDISNPAAMRKTRQVAVGYWDLAIRGDFAYVPTGSELKTFDLSRVGPPVLVDTKPMDWAQVATVIGDRLYVCDKLGMHIYDLSRPDAPLEVNRIRGVRSYTTVAPFGDLLVCTDSSIMTLFDPRIPTDQPATDLLQTTDMFAAVAARGNLAFACYWNNWYDPRGLVAFDVGGPGAPRRIGELPMPPRGMEELQISGDCIFGPGLCSVDISDPANMRLVHEGLPFGRAFTVDGKRAFVSTWADSYRHGISSVDISDPAHPVVLGSLVVSVEPQELAASDNMVVAGADTTLLVVDVSRPDQPVLCSSTPLSVGYCRDIEVHGSLVYYVGEFGILSIVDITNAARPRILSTFYPPGQGGSERIDVGNGIAYLSNRRHGALILDVGDATAPRLLGVIDHQGRNETGYRVMATSDHFVVTTMPGQWIQSALRQCGDVTNVRAADIEISPNEPCDRVPCGPRARGPITVAVLSDKSFDASTIDPVSLRFGPGGATEIHATPPDAAGGGHHRGHDDDHDRTRHLRDVDCDGDLDYVAHFDAYDAGFACGDSVASLTATTIDGTVVCSVAAVTTTGNCRPHEAGDDGHATEGKSRRHPGGCGHDADKESASVGPFEEMPAIAPNPFNPTMEITFSLREASRLRIDVFDLSGRRVMRLTDGDFTTGHQQVGWRGCDDSGRSMASGVYFVRIEGPGMTTTLRAALLR